MARIKVRSIAPGFPGLKKTLNLQPRSIAHDIASRIAPRFTSLAQASYDAGVTVYGVRRKQGKHGPLTLIDSGLTRSEMHFEAIGTVTRCVLGPPWARYLIGRYTILPNGDAYLPVAWYRVFLAAADEVLRAVGARRAA